MQAPIDKSDNSNVLRFSEIGRQTAGLIHELVNPLTVIKLQLEELEEESKRLWVVPRYHKLITRTIRQATIASKRIEQYVSGAQQLLHHTTMKKRFSLCKEINLVVLLYAYRCRQKHIALTFTPLSKPMLYGNPAVCAQCISTVLANAIESFDKKHTGKKEINIKLTSTNNNALVTISDTGTGIPSDKLQHIFDPFYSSKKPQKNFGLGLDVAKHAMEDVFQGSISIKSRVGQGTTVTLSFPSTTSLSPATPSQ